VFIFLAITVVSGFIVRSIVKSYGEYIVPFPDRGKKILQKYFEFYIRLNPTQKSQFERRVQHFIRIKKFIPRNMDEVTYEMKVLISACAIQLTFGLPRVYLQHFKRILVYPDNYYSTINKAYHKGEVNPRYGIIVLSWKAFVQGYYEKEGLNLGLHEMAHALHLENVILNKETNFLDSVTMQEWSHLAKIEMAKIQSGDNSFFRNYGASDEHELFAVAVENFFERPGKFKAGLPNVYAILSKLLNQDPAISQSLPST